MDLYEYQGKQYFARYGIPISPGEVADSVEDAVAAADRVGYPVVVKAQVQVGGRGKAGGVKLAADRAEVELHAGNILGLDIKGHVVKRLWIEHATDISKEYYAGFTLDRAAKLYLAMVSARGGVDIEQVAEEDPDAIARRHVNPLDGLSLSDARALVEEAGLDAEALDGAAEVLVNLYRCYVEGDADLVEINPLVLTPDDRVHALDAKVSLDDDAAYRHPEWDEFAGTGEIDERERLAKEKGLNYIGLDGSVGIIANGAGLAMSTLDVVNQVGGAAANFLDIGGGANADVMANALEVINTDQKVRVILVNIFGGIVRCDEVARGILAALDRVELQLADRPTAGRDQCRPGPGDPGGAGVGSDHQRAHDARCRAACRRGGGRCSRRAERRSVMSIFVDENTRVAVQGLTGSQGRFHGLRNRDYGTKVVAGVTPGKGGTDVDGIPVYDSVQEAVEAQGVDATFVAVPPKAAPGAILQAAEAGVALIVCITEHIPAKDEAYVSARLRRDFPRTRLLGPNCPGIISPGKCNIGITSGDIALPGGPVGIVSRSGTLTYQALHELSQQGVGQTTCVGIGGDPVPGLTFVDVLEAFEADPETRAVMMIGEIGGEAEELAAEFIKTKMTKPVVAYIAGLTAPEGRKMGHAGAIVSGSKGTARAKMEVLAAAGATVAKNPTEAGELMVEIVRSFG